MSFPVPTRLTVPVENPVPTPGSVTIDWSTAAIQMAAEDSLSIASLDRTSFSPPPCAALVMTLCFSLTSLDLFALTDTASIALTDCNSLVTVTVPETLNAVQVEITYAQLDDTSVDNILIALAAGTGEDGLVNLSGNSSAGRTPDSDAAYAALIARGWTITLN